MTVPDDVVNNVTIEIDGVKYNKSVDAQGKAVFEVQIMSNGTRTVVATYDGDNKYLSNGTTANFTVTKRDSQVNVTATGNTVGNNAVITVKVQSNATGYVTVNVNGTNYTINLTSGEGRLEIAGLGNGTYYVHATYLGDDQYNPSTNNTKAFEMIKNVPVITIKVENVTYGNHTVIEISVPGASGNVTIKINDTDKGEFTLVNGKVVFDAGTEDRPIGELRHFDAFFAHQRPVHMDIAEFIDDHTCAFPAVKQSLQECCFARPEKPGQ